MKIPEEVQFIAVKEDIINILYINNPTEKVQLYVVKNFPNNIKYIDNPSEKVQLYVVENSPYNIEYIRNPTEKVKLLALTKFASSIGFNTEFIGDPSQQIISLTKK